MLLDRAPLGRAFGQMITVFIGVLPVDAAPSPCCIFDTERYICRWCVASIDLCTDRYFPASGKQHSRKRTPNRPF